MQVKSIMSHPPVTCPFDGTLEHPARLMWDFDCGIDPLVTGDGRYGLDMYVDDELTPLIDWTEAPEINTSGESNHLRVETEGDTIRLFVNDQLLDEISDDTFTEGEMALAINTFDEGDATATFDNLVVRGKE